jgi:hypothetical protein
VGLLASLHPLVALQGLLISSRMVFSCIPEWFFHTGNEILEIKLSLG